jgi:hypothetical protein
MRHRVASLATAILVIGPVALAADPKLPPGVTIEEPPRDPKAAKVVLVAGSNYYKPGEHEYVAGCAVLADLLRQTPGVAPVFALDWPTKPETFAGARAVVFFADGGDKHPFLKGDRLARVQRLADAGAGIVLLHQAIDVPKDLGDRVRNLTGAAWEKGPGARAHWVAAFRSFPDHPVFRGVTPFKIDDGWLYQSRFAPGMKGVTPLLRTAPPKSPPGKETSDAAVVAWAYDRPADAGKPGRAVVFTGGHLHASFAEEGYRRFLVNGILWSAGLDVPASGAPVALDPADLGKYLAKPPGKK